MTSQPRDYIGQGQSVTLTEPSWRFGVSPFNTMESITIHAQSTNGTSYHWWDLEFAASRGQQLHTGSYANAQRAPFRTGTAPGLDVGGEGRGCNNLFGSFTISRLVVDSQGNVQSFEATFEQHCEQPTAPALRGHVRFGSAGASQQARLQSRSPGHAA